MSSFKMHYFLMLLNTPHATLYKVYQLNFKNALYDLKGGKVVNPKIVSKLLLLT